MENCAILGGNPVRETPIPWANCMGEEEKRAVDIVMESGELSKFLANSGDKFLGGDKVKELESEFCNKFNVRYAVSMNSATSGLMAAVKACGVGPGDEVLVTPYTMSASASAILMNCAVPVFVDIDKETYSIDPNKIESLISIHTKAILTVNIFGLPSNLPLIMEIAKKHNLYVIVDNAQAPGATIDGIEAGAMADIGVYSLNYHKIIHCGEGGVVVTNNEKMARICQLVRNHGEVILDEEGNSDTYCIGYNIRMSEIHAAIGIEQLKKLNSFLDTRRMLGAFITEKLASRRGLEGVIIPEKFTHSYYVYPIKFKKDEWGIRRKTFAKAMMAEGFPIQEGYVKPIYLMNLYKYQHIYDKTTFPFSMISEPTQNYEQGICPVAEKMYFEELLIADICRYPYSKELVSDFFKAIDKIWDERKELKKLELHDE